MSIAGPTRMESRVLTSCFVMWATWGTECFGCKSRIWKTSKRENKEKGQHHHLIGPLVVHTTLAWLKRKTYNKFVGNFGDDESKRQEIQTWICFVQVCWRFDINYDSRDNNGCNRCEWWDNAGSLFQCPHERWSNQPIIQRAAEGERSPEQKRRIRESGSMFYLYAGRARSSIRRREKEERREKVLLYTRALSHWSIIQGIWSHHQRCRKHAWSRYWRLWGRTETRGWRRERERDLRQQ